MGRLLSRLKVVCCNFFYCRSTLVVLCRAVAIPETLKKSPHPPSPDEIGLFTVAFKIVIKKEKMLKPKPQTVINRHHAFVAMCFKILKWSRSVA